MDILDRLKDLTAYRFIGAKTISDAIDEISRLRDEAADYKARYEQVGEYCEALTADKIAAEQEADANRVDAERYRWLRDTDDKDICVVDVDFWLELYLADCRHVSGECLDAAIDAARGKDNEQI